MRYCKVTAALMSALCVFGSCLSGFAAPPPVFDEDVTIQLMEDNVVLPNNDITEIKENTADDSFELFGSESFTAIQPQDYYGRKALGKGTNKEIRLHIYDALADGIAKSKIEIPLTKEGYTITLDDYKAAFNAVIYDYPQFFWVNQNLLSWRSKSNGEVTGGVIYYHDYENLEEAKQVFEDTANDIIKGAGVKPAMSDYEKAKRLHNALIGWVYYDYDFGTLIHTSYDPIVNHEAVCDGYAKAYQYLLYKVGVLSHVVTGYGASGSNPENHAWNIVWIDNEPSYVDVTWDDRASGKYSRIGTTISYKYFNMNDEIMGRDHFINKNISQNGSGYTVESAYLGYSLPSCTKVDNTYYKKEGVWLTNTNKDKAETIDKFADMLAKNTAAKFYVDDNIDARQWLNENCEKIYAKYKAKDPTVGAAYNLTSVSGEETMLYFLEANKIKVDDNYEVALICDKNVSGRLCQGVYDSSNKLISFNDAAFEGQYKVALMYPWQKVANRKTAQYMLMDFNKGYKPLVNKIIQSFN